MANKKVLILLVICALLTGCSLGEKKEWTFDDIHKKLTSMESYSCLAEISHKADDEVNVYEEKQVYQIDGKYRTELVSPKHLEGLTTICTGEEIWQHNPNVKEPKFKQVEFNDFRNQMFLGSFLKNYLQSEGVAVEVSNIEDRQATILEAVIPGGSPHMKTQKLWIDEQSGNPIRLKIYDKDDKEKVNIELLEFVYNPTIDEEIFEVD